MDPYIQQLPPHVRNDPTAPWNQPGAPGSGYPPIPQTIEQQTRDRRAYEQSQRQWSTVVICVAMMGGAIALAVNSHFIVSSADYVHLAVAALSPMAAVVLLHFVMPGASERKRSAERKWMLAFLVVIAIEVVLWHPW